MYDMISNEMFKSTISRNCPLWAFPHGFKTRLLGRGFHTLIRNVSFPSPTEVGSHNGAMFSVTDEDHKIPLCQLL